MKKTILIIFLATGFQNANGKPLTATLPERLVALECPGRQDWELSQAREWRKQGDMHNDSYYVNADQIAKRRDLAMKLTPRGALAFMDDGQGAIKNVDMSNDGRFVSANLPDVDGCRAHLLAMHGDFSSVKYLVDAEVMAKLAPSDRYFARQLIRGMNATFLRTMVDENTFGLSFQQLFDLFKVRDISPIHYGEFDLATDKLTVVDGLPESGDFTAPDLWGEILFNRTGQVRALRKMGIARVVPTRLPLANLDKENPSSYRSCFSLAVYRDDGSMVMCNGQYFNSAGGVLPEGVVSVTSGSVDYNSDADEEPTNRFGVFDYGRGTQKEFMVYYPPSWEISSFKWDVSESQACALPEVTNRTEDSRNVSTFKIPRDCIGILNVSWKRVRARK